MIKTTTVYFEYDAVKMGGFFNLWTTPLTSASYEPPKYRNLKDELIGNDVQPISITQMERIYIKE